MAGRQGGMRASSRREAVAEEREGRLERLKVHATCPLPPKRRPLTNALRVKYIICREGEVVGSEEKYRG